MIRLDRVELLHWDLQPHQVLPLAHGVTMLTGENGSGKTSILDAIKVGLGANRLGNERKISEYVLKQARPVAMIRILVDNRPDPQTRRRPFDPLASLSSDTVTLAVVFRAIEEKEYSRDYYILDGDIVPLEGAPSRDKSKNSASVKPLPNATEYRARLRKVGIGPHYLKLLSLRQGQAAALCTYDEGELFDKLFDIIGGHQALEEWERRLFVLGEQQREQKEVEKDLNAARGELSLLADKVRHHENYLSHLAKFKAIARAKPHVALADARKQVEQLRHRIHKIEQEILSLTKTKKDADSRAEQCRLKLSEIEERQRNLHHSLNQSKEKWRQTVEERARVLARLGELDRLKKAATGIEPIHPATIEEEIETARVEVARGQANQTARDLDSAQIAREIASIDKGLLPFPAEVDEFREKLRAEGIPHHILAEVLEVSDSDWTEAIEGYLGRYRFAVLVQDPGAWPQAAALAREARYPHGVLAPDVRGSSPTDEQSLASIIEIKEARYRSLLARLLRPVRPSDPPRPYSPTKRGVLLANDGFAVSRIEAHAARENRFYLGRSARERRKKELEERCERIERQSVEWRAKQEVLKQSIARLVEDLEAQHCRLRWEAAAGEHADMQSSGAALEEREARLEEGIQATEGDLETIGFEASDTRTDKGKAENKSSTAAEKLGRLADDQRDAENEKDEADEALGLLLAEELPPLDDEIHSLIDEGHSIRTLSSMEKPIADTLGDFTEEEKDPNLPLNLSRQQSEVEAVTERIERMTVNLKETREAAEEAKGQYQETTRRVFRHYFTKLKQAAAEIDFKLGGQLEPREDGRFKCAIHVRVGQKVPVHYRSNELSDGQKAALSILMGMTAVSLESDAAGFFLIDEPFSQSDVVKINELGQAIARTGAQYLVSMPLSADLEQCRDWLQATLTTTKTDGGFDINGRPALAPPIKLGFASGARDD
ncbi:MAG: AAA family ATPase [Deltaproteobacteria bacterium]|nr:AAA family ATPase [Deltaproteobacteria bacterium]